MSPVCIALAQYPVEALANWEAFAQKITHWVTEATSHGAELLVFPEYTGLELGSLLPKAVFTDLDAQLPLLQAFLEPFCQLFSQLAQSHHVSIVVGGFPVPNEAGEYLNPAWVFSPSGEVVSIPKRMLTRFEKSPWHLVPGNTPVVFEAPWGTFAVAICYDSEFPDIVAPLVDAGARLIVVPTCTDTPAGYHRVRIGARARALENQCFVATAPLLGQAPWCEAIDVSVGAAGVFCAVDVGFSDNGIMTEGDMNTPGWVYATLNLTALDGLVEAGQVQNRPDRPWALTQSQAPVTYISLK